MPQASDLMKRQSRHPKSARGCSVGQTPRRAPGRQGAYPSAEHNAEQQQQQPQQHPEFQRISVEISGREGYNAVAVNGVWSFWRVNSGRLAFRREVELEVDGSDAEEGEVAAEA